MRYNMNIEVGYLLTNKCNLNCAMCDHYASMIHGDEEFERFAKIEDFEKNLKRLKIIFKNHEEKLRVKISGGECLLHPQVTDFFDIAKEILPKCKLICMTNGILLEKKLNDENFYNSIRKNNVTIRISDYGFLDFDRFKKYNLNMIIIDKALFFRNMISKTYDMSKSGCSFIDDAHKMKKCTILDTNGDFYNCVRPYSAKFMNKNMGFNFEIIEGNDYFNIFDKNITIVNFYKNKINDHHFCGYCRKPVMIPWKRKEEMNDPQWMLAD